MDAMSEDALTTVLANLRDRLKGDDADRADIWNRRVQPWLNEFWPEAPVRNAGAVSKAMLELLSETGDGFPDGTAWALDYLQPMEGDLYRLRESGHASLHPEATLRLLTAVVPPDDLPLQHRHTLGEVLSQLRVAMPAFDADLRFQTLRRLAGR